MSVTGLTKALHLRTTSAHLDRLSYVCITTRSDNKYSGSHRRRGSCSSEIAGCTFSRIGLQKLPERKLRSRMLNERRGAGQMGSVLVSFVGVLLVLFFVRTEHSYFMFAIEMTDCRVQMIHLSTLQLIHSFISVPQYWYSSP